MFLLKTKVIRFLKFKDASNQELSMIKVHKSVKDEADKNYLRCL